MKKYISIISITICFALIFAFAGCGGDVEQTSTSSVDEVQNESLPEIVTVSGNEQTAKSLKIGVLTSQSGIYGPNGRYAVIGAKYAQQNAGELNINGEAVDIQLLIGEVTGGEDDARAKAASLAELGASAVLVEGNGYWSIGAAEVLKENSIPLIDLTGFSLTLSDRYPTSFSMNKSNESVGKAAANYIKTTLGKKSAYILSLSGDSNAAELAFFAFQQLKALGLNANIRSFETDTTDFASYMKQAVDYDCVILACPLYFSGMILRSMQENGIDTAVVFSNFHGNASAFDSNQTDVSIHCISNYNYDPSSVEFKSLINWIGSDDELSIFAGEFTESGFCCAAVDAVNAIIASALSCNSIDSEKIAKELKAVDFNGLCGKVSFKNDRTRSAAAKWHVCTDGKWKNE